MLMLWFWWVGTVLCRGGRVICEGGDDVLIAALELSNCNTDSSKCGGDCCGSGEVVCFVPSTWYQVSATLLVLRYLVLRARSSHTIQDDRDLEEPVISRGAADIF